MSSKTTAAMLIATALPFSQAFGHTVNKSNAPITAYACVMLGIGAAYSMFLVYRTMRRKQQDQKLIINKNSKNMKTTIKTLAIAVFAIVFSTVEASAQKIATAAIADQHYAAETSNYKFMMLSLALAFGAYLFLQIRRNREVNRMMGKI